MRGPCGSGRPLAARQLRDARALDGEAMAGRVAGLVRCSVPSWMRRSKTKWGGSPTLKPTAERWRAPMHQQRPLSSRPLEDPQSPFDLHKVPSRALAGDRCPPPQPTDPMNVAQRQSVSLYRSSIVASRSVWILWQSECLPGGWSDGWDALSLGCVLRDSTTQKMLKQCSESMQPPAHR